MTYSPDRWAGVAVTCIGADSGRGWEGLGGVVALCRLAFPCLYYCLYPHYLAV